MSRWLIGAPVVLVLGCYLAAAFFAHPFGDDFSYAVAGMRTELLPRLWDEYNLWNGRWASNPLVLRGPLLLGIDRGLLLYRTVPCLLLLIGLISSRSLAHALLPGFSPRDSWLAGGVLLILGLQGLPDPGEGIYWYTGAITYFLPATLTWFLLSIWIRTWREGWSMTMSRSIGAGLLAAFICGFDELHMVFMVILHAVLFLLARADGKSVTARVWIPLLLVMTSAAVMILAPGNSGRGAQFPMSHEIGRTVLGGLGQTARFTALWLLSPVFMSALVVVVGHATSLRRASAWLEEARLPGSLQLGALILLLIAAAMALPYWATGLLGQHRTVNATWLFILPFLTLLVLVQVHRYGPPAMKAALGNVAMLILALGLFFTGTSGTLARDLFSGRMGRFDAQLKERYHVLRKAATRADERVVLEPLQDPPATFHFLDAGPDSTNWINRSMAFYFGVDSTEIIVEQR